MYTGYTVTNGVYVATYENTDETELLRVQVWMDMSLAKNDEISAGAFSCSNLVNYYDKKNSSKILETLRINNLKTGIYEADGGNGSYKSLIDLSNQTIYVIYTLDHE